jgi:beta-N-acetylhexosaminidase
MLAHVILTAVDTLPITLSATAIRDIIRGEIGFDGILISDDLSMKALSAHGSIAEIALKC